MNWQFLVCTGAFSSALVTVLFLGGWIPGQGGSWPPFLAISAAAGASCGTCMRLLVPTEIWRKKR